MDGIADPVGAALLRVRLLLDGVCPGLDYKRARSKKAD